MQCDHGTCWFAGVSVEYDDPRSVTLWVHWIRVTDSSHLMPKINLGTGHGGDDEHIYTWYRCISAELWYNIGAYIHRLLEQALIHPSHTVRADLGEIERQPLLSRLTGRRWLAIWLRIIRWVSTNDLNNNPPKSFRSCEQSRWLS